MKTLIGCILILLGILLGLFMGVWVCFIGGIVQVIEAAQQTPVPALDVAIGVARVFGATLIGGISAFLLIIPGFAMATGNARSRINSKIESHFNDFLR